MNLQQVNLEWAFGSHQVSAIQSTLNMSVFGVLFFHLLYPLHWSGLLLSRLHWSGLLFSTLQLSLGNVNFLILLLN